MGQKSKPLPDLKYLNQRLELDAVTAKLFWKYDPSLEPRWNTRFAGKPAGTMSADGYLMLRLNGEAYYNHRIIFKIYHGYDPLEIDHDDGNRTNNTKANLIDTSSSGNGKNKALLSNNKSGCHGVSWVKLYKKWEAKITQNRRAEHLGYFDNLQDAIQARKNAAVRLGFHTKHGLR